MRSPSRVLLLAVLVLAGGRPRPAAAEARDGAGFRPLFNGTDLRGWRFFGGAGNDSPGDWRTDNGTMVTDGATHGWLVTEDEFDDFELHLEYQLEPGANTGVLIRGAPEGNLATAGMEVQIVDDGAFPNLIPIQATGSIHNIAPRTRPAGRPAGEWNALRIVARGPRITVAWNEVQVLDADLGTFKDQALQKPWIDRRRGQLGLQSWGGRAQFRNVQVLPLSAASAPESAASPNQPILVVEPGGHAGTISTVLFTPDGRELISLSSDHTIRFWGVEAGKLNRVLRPYLIPDGAAGVGDLSPDGRTLAVILGSEDKSEQWIYQIALPEGRVRRVIPTGHHSGVVKLLYSHDGRRIATSSEDTTARIWDAEAGTLERVLRGHRLSVRGLAFSPDDAYLATSSGDETARIWSVATGASQAILRDPERRTFTLGSIDYAPDGSGLVTGSWGDLVRVWNFDGSLRRRLPVFSNHVVKFTPHAETLLVAGSGPGATSYVVDPATGRKLAEFSGNTSQVYAAAVSPDGRLAATGGRGGDNLYLWKLDDGRWLHQLAGKGRPSLGVGWAPDGKAIAWGTLGATNDPAAFGQPKPLGQTFDLQDFAPGGEPEGRYERLRATQGPLSLTRHNMTGIVTIRSGTTDGPRLPGQWTIAHTFLPGDRVAASNSLGLVVYDAKSGAPLHRFSVGANEISLSPDNRYLLTSSNDGALRFWTFDRKAPLLSLFQVEDEWVAWTPEGYYAASTNGEQLIGWQVNNGPAAMGTFSPASQFRKTLYRPDVIRRLLEAGSLDLALAAADAARGKSTRRTEVASVLPPRVAITAPAAGVRLQARALTVQAAARSVGDHAITGLRLLIDGRPAPGGSTAYRTPRSGEIREAWTVEVPPGSHQLTVQADSAVSKAVSDPVTVVGINDPSNRRTLHVLAIGVNNYPDRRITKLDCAVPDAKALRDAFQDHSRKLFGTIDARLLADAQATRANVLADLRRLSATVKADDVAVVFFAGHGDCKIEDELFLLPYDADVRNLKGTGLAGAALKQIMGEWPCTTLLVLDACYTGSIDAKKKRKKRSLPVQADGLLHDLTYDSGLVVMCGAAKEQEAAEEGGQGFFTRAIVEGLSGKADYNKDGVVKFTEMENYVTDRVLELSDKEQEPTFSRTSLVRSFVLSQP